MRERMRAGVALIAVGVVIALLSALFDVLFRDASAGGFGWKQIAGLVVGAAAAVVGAVLVARSREARL